MRKQPLGLIIIFLLICFLVNQLSFAANITSGNAQIYFSPNGGCTDAIIKEINQAKPKS